MRNSKYIKNKIYLVSEKISEKNQNEKKNFFQTKKEISSKTE